MSWLNIALLLFCGSYTCLSATNQPSVISNIAPILVETKGLLQRINYDAEKKDLKLLFRSGEEYIYREVPKEIFEELRKARTPGSYYNHNIRGRFRSDKS